MSASKSKRRSRAMASVVPAIALTALLCGVYALLVKNGKCPKEYSDIVISAAIALSVLTAAAIANTGQGRGGLYGLMLGLVYAAILTAVPLLAYPSEVDWLKIMRIIVIASLSGLIGGNINLGKSNKSFHKSRKKKA